MRGGKKGWAGLTTGSVNGSLGAREIPNCPPLFNTYNTYVSYIFLWWEEIDKREERDKGEWERGGVANLLIKR